MVKVLLLRLLPRCCAWHNLHGRNILADVVFSSWGGKVVDNRQGGEPQAAVFKLPDSYLNEGRIGAFMGWDGLIVFDRDVDIVTMALHSRCNQCSMEAFACIVS